MDIKLLTILDFFSFKKDFRNKYIEVYKITYIK